MSRWDEVDRLAAALCEAYANYDGAALMIGQQLLNALDAARAERCVWRQDASGLYHNVEGRMAALGLSDYCPDCGRKVETAPFTEEVK